MYVLFKVTKCLGEYIELDRLFVNGLALFVFYWFIITLEEGYERKMWKS